MEAWSIDIQVIALHYLDQRVDQYTSGGKQHHHLWDGGFSRKNYLTHWLPHTSKSHLQLLLLSSQGKLLLFISSKSYISVKKHCATQLQLQPDNVFQL